MVKVEAKDLTYGGKYYNAVITTLQKYFSSLQDQIEYILANCTILVYTLCKINGLPYIANSLPNANRLHIVATNGWKAIKYQSGMMLYPNDIVEWGCNHVAYIIEQGTNPQLYASWWTNYDGTSKGKRSDTKLTTNVKDTIQYMFNKHKNRFFHETTFEDECNRGGGQAKPTYVIRYEQVIPHLECDDKNPKKDQILVYTTIQNIRSMNNTSAPIMYKSQIGYYNVKSISYNSDYTWYQLDNGNWIAGVKEQLDFIPKSEKTDYKKLYEEANSKLERIKEIANK